MKLRLAISLLLFGLLSSFLAMYAHANQVPPTYLWDNIHGFIPADQCTFSLADDVDFHVAIHPTGDKPFSEMAGANGRMLKTLPDGSIFKAGENAPAMETGHAASFYSYIRVVGIPSGAWSGPQPAAQSDKGFLAKAAQNQMKYFGIEVNVDTIKMDVTTGDGTVYAHPAVTSIGDTGLPLLRSQWVIEQSGEKYSLFTCGEGAKRLQYMVFDVGPGANGVLNSVAARVLVTRDRARIFHSVNVFQTRLIPVTTVLPAAPAVAANAQTTTAPALTVVKEDEIKGVIIPGLVAPIPHVRGAPHSAPKGSLDGELIICINDASMNAHGDPGNDAAFDTVFPATRFEKVEVRDGAQDQVVSRMASGKMREFVRLYFPAHTRTATKVGWVALANVVPKNKCEAFKRQQNADAPLVIGNHASDFLGKDCQRNSGNDTLCMVCAIWTEDHGSQAGAKAVAGVINKRVATRGYPDSICGVVYQVYNRQYQFRGPQDNDLPKKGSKKAVIDQLNMVIAVAKDAVSSKKAGPYLGFRAPVGRNRDRCASGKQIGIKGNCYRETGEIELDLGIPLPDDGIRSAEALPMGPWLSRDSLENSEA